MSKKLLTSNVDLSASSSRVHGKTSRTQSIASALGSSSTLTRLSIVASHSAQARARCCQLQASERTVAGHMTYSSVWTRGSSAHGNDDASGTRLFSGTALSESMCGQAVALCELCRQQAQTRARRCAAQGSVGRESNIEWCQHMQSVMV